MVFFILFIQKWKFSSNGVLKIPFHEHYHPLVSHIHPWIMNENLHPMGIMHTQISTIGWIITKGIMYNCKGGHVMNPNPLTSLTIVMPLSKISFTTYTTKSYIKLTTLYTFKHVAWRQKARMKKKSPYRLHDSYDHAFYVIDTKHVVLPSPWTCATSSIFFGLKNLLLLHLMSLLTFFFFFFWV
jgi:hypothetical protein